MSHYYKDDNLKSKYEMTVCSSGALKHEQGKPDYDLIPDEAEEAIAMVLSYGAKKYDKHNWRKGIPFSKNYSALRRHLAAWHKGEDLDPESGLPHLSHAITNLAMIITQTKRGRKDLDDRYREE